MMDKSEPQTPEAVSSPATPPISPIKSSRWLKIIVIGGVTVWLLALAGSVIYLTATQKSSPKEVACTQEVKQCPDGSWVGRTGLNCAFAPCPGGKGATPIPDSTANLSRDEVLRDWKTYKNNDFRFSIKYPEDWMEGEVEQRIEKFEGNQYQMLDVYFGPISTENHLGQTIAPYAINVIGISVINIKESKLTVKEALQNGAVPRFFGCGYLDIDNGEPRKIDGRDAIIFKQSPCGLAGSDEAYIIDGTNFYEISDTYFNIDQILSTFQFTD